MLNSFQEIFFLLAFIRKRDNTWIQICLNKSKKTGSGSKMFKHKQNTYRLRLRYLVIITAEGMEGTGTVPVEQVAQVVPI